MIGGITGTLRQPQLLVLGRYDQDGRLRAVGRTTPLKPDAARQLADHYHRRPRPSLDRCTVHHRLGSREPLDPILVVPEPVAEVSADTTVDRGMETSRCASHGCAWTSP
ncbi:hypothetical protein AB0D94_34370 [Streptomyces sp. NPDC048255]|uniref:hypothetical protein n=1 Tax=Streptomyces sp. NPDC048255 TaxID=3154713 RepID=UPI003403F805